MSLTAIPYNRVQTTGNILFATRGGKIHSFNLSDHQHISTWQHPDVEKHKSNSDSNQEPQNEIPQTTEPENIPATEESEPPAKRQKTTEGDLNEEAVVAEPAGQGNAQNKGKGGKGKSKAKNDNHGDRSRMGRVVDRPLITLMTCTDDGKHLIAVSGHDKTVWVFEHDGEGQLTQLSQRAMPKRPSDITTGPGSQIIIADKFGDVYSIPLLMTPLSPSALALRTSTPKQSTTEPAANTFTVHSKRNLAALEHQRKQLEQEKAKGGKSKSEEPSFESNLLLGHVSMLTSLLVTETQGRKYILTADRDEHIRVSRYIPQAHIIEGFCLGHTEFISDMTIPLGTEDILVSGGGDELFVWNWKEGRILSKTNLLSLVQEIAPQAAKVAVSALTSLVYPEDGRLTYVLAICEDIKAIFTWQLTTENELKNPGIIQLPCNPLHITIASSTSESIPKLIVAMDPGQNANVKSLHAYTLARTENRLSSDVEIPIHGQSSDGPEMQVSESEIRNMFYSVENLRKQGGGGEEGGADSVAEGTGEVDASPAPEAQ